MDSHWKAYLPTFRWARFRLFHETKGGAYMPIRMTQVVGGKWWSLSLTRTSPARRPEPTDLDAAMHSVWLHGDWRWLTRSMTTEQREAAADAVQRYSDRLAAKDARSPSTELDLRWWREDQDTETV